MHSQVLPVQSIAPGCVCLLLLLASTAGHAPEEV
jgi:hypothetical protein